MFSRSFLALLALGAALPATLAPVSAQSAAELTGPKAAPAPAPAPAPAAAPVIGADWSRKDAGELLRYVEGIGSEGLDPADYNMAALREAIDSEDDGLSRLATSTFLKVASDLKFGHVRDSGRVDWHVKDDSWNVYDQQALLDRAVKGDVAEAFESLHPTHPQYAALKALLADKSLDSRTRDRVRINLDRWRWLPQNLGSKYVIVNVPAYTVALVENGQTINRRRAVAGAIKTPTPSLSAVITGAIFNPWWEVPQSITPEVRGKKGYVAVKDDSGKVIRWRQPPGPSNALGRMKLVMGNPYAIYLHDTNAKNLFNRQARAFSHGCIRTEDAVGFAQTLLEGTDWNRGKIDQILASGKATQANLAAPVPVYIVYFTVAATSDGPPNSYADMYSRDGKALAALTDRKSGTALASSGN
ncbi:MAG TPA: L,D-transpeptidase family protein [Allosphingosinicella sp.]|nr:L,D-transpeptidase family protein [Allosphingosinicella sp.]